MKSAAVYQPQLHARRLRRTCSMTLASGKYARPSPHAIQQPSVEPAMPSSMMAGLGWIVTDGKPVRKNKGEVDSEMVEAKWVWAEG